MLRVDRVWSPKLVERGLKDSLISPPKRRDHARDERAPAAAKAKAARRRA